MRDQLELLWELQKIDLDLRHIKEERERYPREIKKLDERMSIEKERIQAEKGKIELLEKERREKERQLSSSQEKIKKTEARMSEVKTNKEYQAFLTEIETIKSASSREEEEILQVLEEIDELKKDLSKREKEGAVLLEKIEADSMMPMVVMSLSGATTPDKLEELANTQIVPALKSVDGVLSLEIEGGDNDQVVIAPSPEKMVEYGISASQIVMFLASQYDSLDAIEITSMGVVSVVLKNIADVGQGPPPSSVVTRTDGRPSLGILVMKEDEANIIDTANAVEVKVEELKPALGTGIEFFTVFDQSDFIESSINELWQKALVGGALAIVLVFLFLWAFREFLDKNIQDVKI